VLQLQNFPITLTGLQVPEHSQDSNAFPAIPWNFSKVAEVMVLWTVLFFVVGGQTAYVLPKALGINPSQLNTCGHALGYFLCDLSNLVLTLALMTRALHPHHIWKMGLFSLRPTWSVFIWGFAAILLFPAIDTLSHVSMSWFLIPPDALGQQLEQSLCAGDAAANMVYLTVVSVCTPVWEEAIFRGFLLTSLTRYMRPLFAIVASSAVFAIAHFSWHRTPYLMLLGFVIGFVFVRTRNLLTPMLVHALWNLYVFTKLAAQPSLGPAAVALFGV
jgi:uncharacterized protein